MPARPGDSIYNILWKLVESVGGTPRPGDSKRDLLAKYLRAIGGTPIVGDTFYDLLVKVVRIKGGTPLPGDTVWGLLVKWLQAEGECRKCGDSQYDLWKRILKLGESEPPAVNGLLAGLTGYWKMEEAGAGNRLDSHINGYHFTAPQPPSQGVGIIGNAQEFDGVNDELDYDDSVSQVFNGLGSQSISLWAMLLTNQTKPFFGKITVPFDGWVFSVAIGPKIRYTRATNALPDAISVESAVLDLATWYHVVGTFNSDTLDQFLYINGVRIDGFNDIGATNTSTNLICGTENAHSEYANVRLDEIGYWDNRVLSQTDVNVLYNTGLGFAYENFN